MVCPQLLCLARLAMDATHGRDRALRCRTPACMGAIMTVKTRPMDEAPAVQGASSPATSQETRRAPSMLIPACMALLFGLPIWIVGARYTLDGWVIGLNLIAQIADLPWRL